jgi:hypothetical protein
VEGIAFQALDFCDYIFSVGFVGFDVIDTDIISISCEPEGNGFAAG